MSSLCSLQQAEASKTPSLASTQFSMPVQEITHGHEAQLPQQDPEVLGYCWDFLPLRLLPQTFTHWLPDSNMPGPSLMSLVLETGFSALAPDQSSRVFLPLWLLVHHRVDPAKQFLPSL